MTTTENLTARQAATLALITGEVSRFAAVAAGANIPALNALTKKGLITARRAAFLMPTGPLAGETVDEIFYTLAD